MAYGLHHVHIKSKDPWASADWWIDMFGEELLPGIEFGSMLFVPVMFDGVRINFTTPGPGEDESIADWPAPPHYGLEHLGIRTDDVDGDVARFRDQGLTVYDRRPGPGGLEIAFVATPDGVTLELVQESD